MSEQHQSIRGMHDILPVDAPIWDHVETVVRDAFRAYGFEQIRIPVLEKTAVFSRAIGQATDVVEKEMYSFDDRNGDSLSLRPEGTAGVVRAALQNGLLYGAPLRLWYLGPMFRYERPQQGRTRQFHQAGAEVFGAEGPDVDAELLAMGERIWRGLGLTAVRLELNSLGSAEERAAYRDALVDYMRAHRDALDQDSLERLERNPLRILDSKDERVRELLADAPLLTAYLGEESKNFFDELRRMLDHLRIEHVINPRLVRGLDYYCHTVFEWITGDLGAQGTICAGGRYDGLIEVQGGRPWPGTGFAMGLERLVALVQQKEAAPEDSPHAYLVMAGETAKLEGLALAERLRDVIPQLRVVCNAGSSSFKSQFKRADRSGALLALVLGENEVEAGTVTVKPLREQAEQLAVPQNDLAAWLARWLARTEPNSQIAE